MNIRILTITGRPGIGKSTVINKLIELEPEKYQIFPGKSFTTRLSRSGDVPGEYEYISHDEFADREERGDFLWTASHSGNYYATRQCDVVAALKDTAKVSIMTLTPDAVGKLHKFAQEQYQASSCILSFYITHKHEETIVFRRLVERGASPKDAQLRCDETKTWFTDIRIISRKYTDVEYIDNPHELEPGFFVAQSIIESIDTHTPKL